MKRIVKLVSLAALVALPLIPPQIAMAQPQPLTAAASQSCQLNNGIKHVVYITFDNTHLFRDRQNALSDLEQMPNLLNFLRDNGTLSDNEHTILISHTAGGILSSLTGLYPDRMGITVSNSYRYFKPNGTTASTPAFKYWTDLVDDTSGTNDPLPNMVTTGGLNTPAPWVPYTRAGCDFGAVATANVVLENTNTTTYGDMTKVFGAGSTDWNLAAASNAAPSGTAARAKAQTDYVGFAIHCGQGGGICNGQSGARPDSLPDEPGGYAGFKGLFGAKYVNPAITGGQAAVNDTNGQPIQDPFHQNGFPGFDGMFASTTLGYVAQMLEAGVPITYGYISDAHDNHMLVPPRSSGPGESDYVAQLHSYDQAFGAFFARLASHGIDRSNTLFAFTSDEGDHYAGGNSTDGTWSHTFCNISLGQTCPANQIGEVNQNLNKVLPAGYTPPAYSVHSDSAPTFYVNGNPARDNAALRTLERNFAAAQAIDPYISTSPTPLTLWMADPVEQKALHMVNADPRRTPNFTLFANPDYFLSTFDSACKNNPATTDPRYGSCIDYHFAWSHGDATDDIGRTWLGLVGPGVKNLGQTSRTWSDHTDIRPTILALLGLKDSYEPDGAVLADFLQTSAVSRDLRAHHASLVRLHEVYKNITAPFGPYAHDTLVASTAGIRSGSTGDDGHYASVEAQIETMTNDRDALAAQMRTALTVATFGGGEGASEQDLKGMIDHGQAILAQASALAASA